MQIFVKLQDGRTYTFNVIMSDIIDEIKYLIQSKTNISRDTQILSHDGIDLKNNLTIKDYDIRSRDTLYLRTCLDNKGSFNVVSQKHMRNEKLSDDAPKWRSVSDGLILCGKCQNISCDAYKKSVLIRQKFVNNYELIHAREPCPMCGEKVDITNFGFFNCQWKYNGSLEDGIIKSTMWTQTALNACEFFDEEKYGKLRWNNLLISTRNGNCIKIE